jgi:hypothetical protein
MYVLLFIVTATLAILVASIVGLYKIFLGIGLVIAGMKAILVMAWALAISKHVPNAWSQYSTDSHSYGPFGPIGNKFGPYGNSFGPYGNKFGPPNYPDSGMDWLFSFFRRQG